MKQVQWPRHLTLLLILGLSTTALAEDYHHGYGHPSGHWNNPDAWTPAGPPGPSDTAIVTYGISLPDGQVTPVDVEIGTLNLDTYISWGPAPPINLLGSNLTINDGGQWQWGGFSDYDRRAGQVNQYGTFTLVDDINDHYGNGSGVVNIISHEIQWGMTFNNYGTMQHDSLGAFHLGADACQYVNHGTHNFTGDGFISTQGHGGERTTNYGTMVKSGGVGESYINGELLNAGVVEAQSGTLAVNNSLDYAGSWSHELLGGTWIARPGASVVLSARGELFTIEAPARVVLDGATANLYTTQTSVYTPLEASLTTNAGTLEVYGDRTFSNPLTNTGTLILGDVATIAASITSAGLVSVGNSPGRAVLTGDFEQVSDGALDIELGGLVAGDEFDVLAVSGTATLAGDLDVSYWDGFVAQVGDSFRVLEAGTLVGAFDDIAYPDDRIWETQYDYTMGYVTLTLVDVPEPAALLMLLLAGAGLRQRGR